MEQTLLGPDNSTKGKKVRDNNTSREAVCQLSEKGVCLKWDPIPLWALDKSSALFMDKSSAQFMEQSAILKRDYPHIYHPSLNIYVCLQYVRLCETAL
jgi:hypothetical protein